MLAEDLHGSEPRHTLPSSQWQLLVESATQHVGDAKWGAAAASWLQALCFSRRMGGCQ